MDDKLVLALVAAASAIVGGLVTSVVAPWVKHKLERSHSELARKRKLVADWRQMITEIAGKTDEQDEAQSLLQNHPAFLSLEPHLSEEARRAAYGRNFTVAVGVHVPYPLHVIKNDISRIEKAWKIEA